MAQKKTLFGEDDSNDCELTINKDYADHYQMFRQREELQKLKDLQKEISSESSESESEDEPVVADKDFLVTLSLLKGKDPRIYDEDYVFYNENEDEKPKSSKVKKEKPMFMKDYERKMLLERNGKFSSDEDDDVCNKPSTSKGPVFPEEIEAATKDFMKAAYSDEEEREKKDSDFGGLFEVRKKTQQEEAEEEAEHVKWLKGQSAKVDKKTKKDLAYLREYWNDPNIDDGEKFLRDFILNQKNILKDDVTADQIAELSDEEKVQEQQEVFEHKYNFRFEEPDQEFIKRYPRTIGDSLRREDTRRKQQRDEYTERKKKEKELMREELKRLKSIKRKEIEDRFMKLKEASGKEELNFDESDMESDFDPDKHDRKMKELFDDNYYDVEEEQKPEFEFDEDIDDEDWDHWKREDSSIAKVKKDSRSDSSGTDSDPGEGTSYSRNRKAKVEQDILESTRRKKGRKKSMFAKIVAEPKPLYDPEGKSFNEYLDEYYKLDFEDVIGDQPVRFKYRKVVPNDFGLTVNEILTAQDKELNRWCSIKKTCQYRRDEEEEYDVKAFKKKAENVVTKQKILHSVYAPPEEEEEDTPKEGNTISSEKSTSRKKRKRKKKNIVSTSQENNLEGDQSASDETARVSSNSLNETEPLSEKKLQKEKKKKIKDVNIDCLGNTLDNSRASYDNVSEISVAQTDVRAENDGEEAESSKKTRKSKRSVAIGSLNESISTLPSSSDMQDLLSSQQEQATDPTSSAKKRKRNRKKKNASNSKSDEVSQDNRTFETEAGKAADKGPKIQHSQRNHKRKRSEGFNGNFNSKSNDKRLQISNDRLAAFGINPKKFKNSVIYSQK